MLPNAGQFPTPNGSALAALTPGPMARHASDLATLTRIMAGQDAGDPYSLEIEMHDPKDVRLEGLTVIPIEENGAVRVSDVMKREVRRAAKALEERGAIIKEPKFPRMRFALEIWATMLERGTTESYDAVVGGDRGIPASEFFLLPFGRSRHTFPPLVLALIERISRRLPIDRQRFADEADELRTELEAALGEDGVLIHPPYTRPAPLHHDAWRTPFAPTCTALFNVLEMPMSVVPTGFDAQGLPLAVQVGAARRRDHVAIRAALALEEHFGGWVMATPAA
jgi:fatty acid amide hydrolase 2